MGKTIKLTEAELHKLIFSKLKEELEHNVDLEYSPAIGNKKRGPGENSMDQMKKRKNKKLDESFDEKSIYRKLPDGDVDYEGETGGNEGTYTLELSNDAYAFAFEQEYGRVPGNMDSMLEDFNMPESVIIKFNVSGKDIDGNRGLDDWDIDESSLSGLSGEMAGIVRKAAEYEMENVSGDELSGYMNESRKVRMTESQFHSFITESVKNVLSEIYSDKKRK